MQNKINEMYLEATGQKIIPDEIINAKKNY